MNATPVIIAASLALLAITPFNLSRSAADAHQSVKKVTSPSPLSFAGTSQHYSRNPSGLPIPRFAVLEADKTWGRIGPSFDYPVRYEFNKRSLPVKIIGETKDNEWRHIEDYEGAQMWIHRKKLISRKTAMINLTEGTILRTHPHPSGSARAHLDYGVIARYDTCDEIWCEVTIDNFRGFVRRDALWGVNT